MNTPAPMALQQVVESRHGALPGVEVDFPLLEGESLVTYVLGYQLATLVEHLETPGCHVLKIGMVQALGLS